MSGRTENMSLTTRALEKVHSRSMTKAASLMVFEPDGDREMELKPVELDFLSRSDLVV